MAKRFALLGLALLACTTSEVFAQSAPTASINGTSATFVTTSVPFLRISPDARAGAMGDASIAVSPDANSQYWNVAKIPFTTSQYGISATYTPWLKDLVPDIFLAYLSGYAKFGQEQEQAISGSMRYFSLGNINYTDYIGNSIGIGMPREYSFDLGYSRKLSEFLSTGLSMRYIHSNIASGVQMASGSDYKPGNAFAADLGVFYSKSVEKTEDKINTFNFGAVISNLGSKIAYNATTKNFIPQNLGVGVAYTWQMDQYNKFTLALDVNKLLVPPRTLTSGGGDTLSLIDGVFKSFSTGDQLKQLNAAIGAEYWYQNTIAFRAGYFYEDKTNGDRQYITCGLGVRYNVFQLNASYLVPQGSGITRNPLSNTLRFTLMFEFDKMEDKVSTSDDTSKE